MKRFAIETDARLESLPSIAEFTERVIMDLKLPPEVGHKLSLSLDEAVNNVVSYAYPDQPGKMQLVIEAEPEELRAMLTDQGLAFDPTQQPTPDLDVPIEERKIGGLGIHLIRKMTDEFKYNRTDGVNQMLIVIRWRNAP
ncbi:MAG: ATP-binding protein [Lentisphaerota bacterium]